MRNSLKILLLTCTSLIAMEASAAAGLMHQLEMARRQQAAAAQAQVAANQLAAQAQVAAVRVEAQDHIAAAVGIDPAAGAAMDAALAAAHHPIAHAPAVHLLAAAAPAPLALPGERVAALAEVAHQHHAALADVSANLAPLAGGAITPRSQSAAVVAHARTLEGLLNHTGAILDAAGVPPASAPERVAALATQRDAAIAAALSGTAVDATLDGALTAAGLPVVGDTAAKIAALNGALAGIPVATAALAAANGNLAAINGDLDAALVAAGLPVVGDTAAKIAALNGVAAGAPAVAAALAAANVNLAAVDAALDVATNAAGLGVVAGASADKIAALDAELIRLEGLHAGLDAIMVNTDAVLDAAGVLPLSADPAAVWPDVRTATLVAERDLAVAALAAAPGGAALVAIDAALNGVIAAAGLPAVGGDAVAKIAALNGAVAVIDGALDGAILAAGLPPVAGNAAAKIAALDAFAAGIPGVVAAALAPVDAALDAALVAAHLPAMPGVPAAAKIAALNGVLPAVDAALDAAMVRLGIAAVAGTGAKIAALENEIGVANAATAAANAATAAIQLTIDGANAALLPHLPAGFAGDVAARAGAVAGELVAAQAATVAAIANTAARDLTINNADAALAAAFPGGLPAGDVVAHAAAVVADLAAARAVIAAAPDAAALLALNGALDAALGVAGLPAMPADPAAAKIAALNGAIAPGAAAVINLAAVDGALDAALLAAHLPAMAGDPAAAKIAALNGAVVAANAATLAVTGERDAARNTIAAMGADLDAVLGRMGMPAVAAADVAPKLAAVTAEAEALRAELRAIRAVINGGGGAGPRLNQAQGRLAAYVAAHPGVIN